MEARRSRTRRLASGRGRRQRGINSLKILAAIWSVVAILARHQLTPGADFGQALRGNKGALLPQNTLLQGEEPGLAIEGRVSDRALDVLAGGGEIRALQIDGCDRRFRLPCSVAGIWQQ